MPDTQDIGFYEIIRRDNRAPWNAISACDCDPGFTCPDTMIPTRRNAQQLTGFEQVGLGQAIGARDGFGASAGRFTDSAQAVARFDPIK